MDVLEYWQPTIDWSKFKQGGVSDAMWRGFCDVVQLCHAREYWREAAEKRRLTRLPKSMNRESEYTRRKRRNEWKAQGDRLVGHMNCAGHRIQEKMAQLSTLFEASDQGKPDWTMWFALRLAVRDQPFHERSRSGAAAFEEFDADEQLHGEPAKIAQRWLSKAGLIEAL